ncbi:hypothetical protein BGZ94_008457 [Podila epigama]|nr:hypothetical protein BGZ94_008457 [Podila epigama]
MPSFAPTTVIRILRPLPLPRAPAPGHSAASAVSSDGKSVTDPIDPIAAALRDLDPTDPIALSNEFDRTKTVTDIRAELLKAGYTDIEIVPVSLTTITQVVDSLAKEMVNVRSRNLDFVVFQLCDGTEVDGYPGVSMIKALEERKVPFTGSDSAFYIISSSKPVLKKELQAAHVPTSSFQEFDRPVTMSDLDHIVNEIGFPMIVKPSISYASINISTSSVVHNRKDLLEQVNKSLAATMPEGKPVKRTEHIGNQTKDENQHPPRAKNTIQDPKEVDIETPTVFVEKFLAGREFTALVIGDKDWGVRVFPVAERAFDPKLGKYERLLAFDQYWAGYDLNGGHPSEDNENFCKYQLAKETWQGKLQQVAKEAYLALGGSGYGRVDIRTVEMETCDPVVLEVNANCGFSFEKDSSSLANILIMSNVDSTKFVMDIVDHALHRNHRISGVPRIVHQSPHSNSVNDVSTESFSPSRTPVLVQG